MRAIFSRVKLKEKQIWLLAVLVLFAAVAEMILPSLLAQMINSGVADSSRSTVLSLSAVMAGVTLLACIVNFLSVKIASRISTDFSATLRGQVFEKVQSFSAAELDKFGTASLVTRSTSDITNVQNFLTMLLRIGILGTYDGDSRFDFLCCYRRTGQLCPYGCDSGVIDKLRHCHSVRFPLFCKTPEKAGSAQSAFSGITGRGSSHPCFQ